MNNEDIKVLEEKIKSNRKDFENEGYHCYFDEETMQLVENLIKGYKELDKENTRQHELLGKIHEKYQKDYIPKSKVREKIEELKQERKKQDEEDEIHLFYDQIDITNIIEVLEQLLQEGDTNETKM